MYITEQVRTARPLLTKGAKLMLLSTFCFSLMQFLIKAMPQIPSIEHVFFRSFITWVFSVGFLLTNGVSLVGKNQKLLLLRGVVGSISMFSFFYILPRIPFASSVTFKYLSPMFTTLFAVVLLNERPRWMQWGCIGLSFAGVLLLKGFDARIGMFDFGIGILSGVAGGLLYIVIRKIGDDDHPLVVVHYFMLLASVVSGFWMIPYWVTPTLTEAAGLFLIGFVGFVAQVYMTKAFMEPDDLSSLAILRYAEVLYALLIGFLWFGESYTLLSFCGIALILSGLIFSIRAKPKTKQTAISETVTQE